MTKAVVCNAGPLIHLDELSSLDCLSDFPTVLVPETVWGEVGKFRPGALPQPFLTRLSAPGVMDPKILTLWKTFSLDIGEAECLAVMATLDPSIGPPMFLTDDAAARLAGESLGVEVHGSIGVLVRAIRKGRRTPTQVIEILDQLPSKSTLYIEKGLLAQVKARIRTEFSL